MGEKRDGNHYGTHLRWYCGHLPSSVRLAAYDTSMTQPSSTLPYEGILMTLGIGAVVGLFPVELMLIYPSTRRLQVDYPVV